LQLFLQLLTSHGVYVWFRNLYFWFRSPCLAFWCVIFGAKMF